MASIKSILPQCGLYRTTKSLPEHEASIPANTLVYFHNHSDSGLPVVIAPEHNILNRWHFHGAGIAFRGLSWASDGLRPVLAEGFYMLKKDLVFDGGSWPKGTLVQLGYTRNADPILFIAQQRANLDENDLFFSDRGVGKPAVTHDFVAINLEPLRIYEEPVAEGGHGTGTQSH